MIEEHARCACGGELAFGSVDGIAMEYCSGPCRRETPVPIRRALPPPLTEKGNVPQGPMSRTVEPLYDGDME